MTERWRKKLGDLDRTGPSDEVFDRAHEGPQHPDDVIPLPKTSTKIVTGVAAFLVFALAISVFAIPALRMATPGSAGVSMELPLWPARSLDELESLQQRAESGEVDAVWALDPVEVGSRFGAEVLGWDATRVDAPESGRIVDPGTYASAYGASGYPTSSPPTGYPSGPPTSPPVPRFIWLVLSYDALCSAPCPQDVAVELYQPLGVGDGSLWAVARVQGQTSQLGGAGGRLRDGDSIYAGTRLFRGELPTLAYHVGPGSCDVDYATSEWAEARTGEEPGTLPATGAGLTLPVQHGCTEPTPGYVWLATAAESLIADDESAHVSDPFAGGGTMLTSLTAVPVTFVPSYPTGPSSGYATGSFSVGPTPTPVEPSTWTTYVSDSEFGWSIDVPSTADVSPVDDGAKFMIDGEPLVTIIRLSGAERADDSRFPLSEDPSRDFTFRGNGQAFEWIPGQNWEDVDPEPGTLLRMLDSLRFEPWDPNGGTRNGWAALPTFPTSAEWVVLGNGVYVVFREESAEGFRVYGPIESCGEGQNTELTQGGTVAVQECPDGTSVEYTYEDGGGQPERLVIVAHDGSRLVQLP